MYDTLSQAEGEQVNEFKLRHCRAFVMATAIRHPMNAGLAQDRACHFTMGLLPPLVPCVFLQHPKSYDNTVAVACVEEAKWLSKSQISRNTVGYQDGRGHWNVSTRVASIGQ